MTNIDLNTLKNLIPQTAKGGDLITSIRGENDARTKDAKITVQSKDGNYSGNRISWHVQKLRIFNNSKIREKFIRSLFNGEKISDIKKSSSQAYKDVLDLIGKDRKKPLNVENARNAIAFMDKKLFGVGLYGKAAEISNRILVKNIMSDGLKDIRIAHKDYGRQIDNPVIGSPLEKTLERFALLKLKAENDGIEEKRFTPNLTWDDVQLHAKDRVNLEVGNAINQSTDVRKGYAEAMVSEFDLAREKMKLERRSGNGGSIEEIAKSLHSEAMQKTQEHLKELQTKVADKVNKDISVILEDPNLSDNEKIKNIEQYIDGLEHKPEKHIEDSEVDVENMKKELNKIDNRKYEEVSISNLNNAVENYRSKVALPSSEISLFLSAEGRNKPEFQTQGLFDPEKYMASRLDSVASAPFRRIMDEIGYRLDSKQELDLKELPSDFERLKYVVDLMNKNEIKYSEKQNKVELTHNDLKKQLEDFQVQLKQFRDLHFSNSKEVN